MTALTVVSDNPAPEPAPESISQRVRRLQEEARGLAREHTKALQLALAEAAHLAKEIADGGDAYHVGVRELAGRMAEDLEHRRQTIEALVARKASH